VARAVFHRFSTKGRGETRNGLDAILLVHFRVILAAPADEPPAF
jgi:hypothetical protein